MNQARSAPALALFAISFLSLLPIAACNRTGVTQRLGRVSGKVTLGGQPLANALVMFSPVKPGSPSAGRTDAKGEYTLMFTKGVKGAEVGEHTVIISTFQEAIEDPPTPEVPEKVPLKYREGPDVPKAEVKSGSNTIDFALEPGPVEAPKPKGGPKGKQKGPVVCY